MPPLPRLSLAIPVAVAQAPQAGQAPAIDKNKLSYAIGFQLGSEFRDKQADIDLPTVIRGLQDAHAGREATVPAAEMQQNLAAYQEKMLNEARQRLQQLAAENKTRSDRFMAETAARPASRPCPTGSSTGSSRPAAAAARRRAAR